MRRVFLFPSLFLLLLGCACFLFSAGTVGSSPQLVFCNGAQIHSMDPAAMSWSQDIRVAEGLWEGLTEQNPKTLAPIPGVAKRWTISADGLTYRFYLRHDARWSNGKPVTAADFIFAWKRMLHPAARAAYLQMLFHLAGGHRYYTALEHGGHPSFKTVGARAKGPYELTVRLAGPCPYFLDLMSFPPFYPLYAPAMRPFELKPGHPGHDYSGGWTRPPNLITNGPFKLSAWKFHQYLDLRRNKYYWDRAAVGCRRIRIVAYSDEQTAFLAYESHAVDVLSFVPSQFDHALARQERLGKRDDVHYFNVFGTYYYVYNCAKKPTDNRLLRKALDMAIDKKEIVRDITRMDQRPVRVIVPPGSVPGYRAPRGLGFNVKLARQLLARAGYPGGRGLPPLDFLTNDQPSLNGLIAQAVGQMWSRNLGVHIRIRQEESKSFHSDMVAGNFQIARAGWYGDYRDPTTFLDLARTGNPNNLGRYSDPVFDHMMRAADHAANPAKRFALLRQAESRLVDHGMPFIPLYQYGDGLMFRPKEVGGIYPNVQMIVLLKYLRKLR